MAPSCYQKTYFSIGNLRAIMEISIPAWLSLKSTLITYLVLLLAIKVIAFWEISPLALLCALNYVLGMAKWEISNFSFSVWLVGY